MPQNALQKSIINWWLDYMDPRRIYDVVHPPSIDAGIYRWHRSFEFQSIASYRCTSTSTATAALRTTAIATTGGEQPRRDVRGACPPRHCFRHHCCHHSSPTTSGLMITNSPLSISFVLAVAVPPPRPVRPLLDYKLVPIFYFILLLV